MMEKFNVNTELKSNTYYVFDKTDSDIFQTQTKKAGEKKYLSITYKGTEGVEALSTAFYLKDKENITLDFGGAVITLHGLIQPFIIDHCTDITIKNVTVEYERANYTELDVIKHDGNELWCRPKEKFPCRVENGYFIPYSSTLEDRNVHKNGCMFMQAFDRETREGAGLAVIYLGEEIVEEQSPPADYIPHIKVRSEGESIVFTGDIPKNYDSQHVIDLEHGTREITSVAMYHSKNITLENYRILNGIGMGLFAVSSENVYISGLRLINDELSHGILSNAADGIHFVASRGEINISDSIVEGTMDDALNIHSNFYFVEDVEKNAIKARRSDKSCGASAYMDVFQKGDLIAVYSGDTMEEKKKFVLSDKSITGKWTVDLLTDGETDGLCKGDLIENLSTNADIHITDSRFAKSNGNLRFQSRGKIILENSRLEMPVLLTGDTNYWYESSPVRDMTVKNCIFSGQRAEIRIIPEFSATEKAPYYHSGIRISDSRFDSKKAMLANYADDIVFENVTADGETVKPELNQCGRVIIK